MVTTSLACLRSLNRAWRVLFVSGVASDNDPDNELHDGPLQATIHHRANVGLGVRLKVAQQMVRQVSRRNRRQNRPLEHQGMAQHVALLVQQQDRLQDCLRMAQQKAHVFPRTATS